MERTPKETRLEMADEKMEKVGMAKMDGTMEKVEEMGTGKGGVGGIHRMDERMEFVYLYTY